jgi:O-Antigen ligase
MTDSGPAPAPASGRVSFEPAALILLAILAGTWSWWAWQEGGYFGVVLLPGTVAICVAAALLAALAPWRIDLRLSRPVTIALAALVGLGVWTIVSALWSPAADTAVADGQRVLLYALAFGLGLSLCSLLRSRIELALAPLAIAGGVAGLAAVIALGTGDDLGDLLDFGTLDYPLGYRNANAAFFAIALFPAVGLAAAARLDWRLRGLALGAATLCVDLFLLSQSRGSVPAIGLALVVYALASPFRLRALCWLALAVIPALGSLPALTDLYRAANEEGVRSAVAEMHTTATMVALTALVAVALGAIAARYEAKLPGLGPASPRGNRPIAVGIGVGIAVALVAFVAAVGNPGDWLGERIDEFKGGGTPDVTRQSSRFTLDAASDRYDLWRVALDDLAGSPVGGEGSGGFEYSYAREREVARQEARDAHGVPFELGGELGLVGLLLFVAAIGGSAFAVLSARRLGPAEGALGAVALASGAYWLVHTSIDWFWAYPVVTAPVLALLGSACGPLVSSDGERPSRASRAGLIVVLLALGLSAVAPFLANRYVDDAYAVWREDLQRAYDDLDRAASLNRLSDEPLLAEGTIAREVGDRRRAIAAFEAASARRPDGWAAHYLLAELQAGADPRLAREQIAIALELNPLDRSVRRLARELGVSG